MSTARDHVNVRVWADLHRRLGRLAHARGQSTQSYINQVLQGHLGDPDVASETVRMARARCVMALEDLGRALESAS